MDEALVALKDDERGACNEKEQLRKTVERTERLNFEDSGYGF